VTDTIEKIGGTQPKSFETFVREQPNEPTAEPTPATAPA
jgi:hypothetical protein